MTDDELMERAHSLLKTQKESFDGEAWQQAWILGATETTLMSIDPAMMSSAHSKDLIAAAIREQARRLKAEAVLFFSDMWIGHQTPAQMARTKSIELMQGKPLDLPEMARAGLTTQREALCVFVLQPKRTRHLAQFYRRTPDGRIIWEEEADSGAHNATGRAWGRFVDIWG